MSVSLPYDRVAPDASDLAHAADPFAVRLPQDRVQIQPGAAERHRLARASDDAIDADTGLEADPHARFDKAEMEIGVRWLLGFDHPPERLAPRRLRKLRRRNHDGKEMRRLAEQRHPELGCRQRTALADD